MTSQPAASGSNQGDIVYQATINDKTGEFFDKFDARLEGMSNKVEQGFSKVEAGLSKAGLIGGVIGGLVSAGVGMAVQAIGNLTAQVKGFMTESANLRARADTLGVTLDVVGNNAGYSKEQMNDFEKSLRKTGISLIASRDSLVKMMQSELDLASAAKLARAAQDAAVIAGTNSSDAFTRILHGITTLQPEMLRTLGLTVSLEQEMTKYAAANKKSVQEITYAEKKQIMLNAALGAAKNIAGSYEAAMGTVGKKMGSLVRVQEDLKVAFGGFFQSAMGENIDFTMEQLKRVSEWLEENQDLVEEWGAKFGDVLDFVLKRVGDLIDFLITVPSLVEDFSMWIAKVLGSALDVASPEEIESRRSQLGTYFAQGAALLIGFVSASVQTLFSLGDLIARFFKDVVWKAVKGDDPAEVIANMDAIAIDFLNTGNEFNRVFAESTAAAAEFTGAVERTKDPVEELAKSNMKAAKAAEEFEGKLLTLTNGLDALYRKMQEDVEARALKSYREELEKALKDSWAAEDEIRAHNEKVQQIMEGATEGQKQAAENLAKARLDIERNYQRQLRDMQARFEFDASESARARDAVGLLRMIRQHSFELQQAKVAKTDQLKDARSSYEEQMRDLDEQRAKQLAALEEQEQKELESKQRALERQRQLDELHRQWEQEDRDTAYAKQLADLLKQMGSLTTEQQKKLDEMLGQWDTYYGDLIAKAQAYQAQVNAIVTPANAPTPATGTTPDGRQITPNTPGMWTPPPGTGVQGQAGQVSELLTNPVSLLAPTGYGVPRLPTSYPGQSGPSSRTLKVEVTGDNLDPYIQRILVQGLLEIERNNAV